MAQPMKSVTSSIIRIVYEQRGHSLHYLLTSWHSRVCACAARFRRRTPSANRQPPRGRVGVRRPRQRSARFRLVSQGASSSDNGVAWVLRGRLTSSPVVGRSKVYNMRAGTRHRRFVVSAECAIVWGRRRGRRRRRRRRGREDVTRASTSRRDVARRSTSIERLATSRSDVARGRWHV